MPDQIAPNLSGGNLGLRLHDNGDGSFALCVYQNGQITLAPIAFSTFMGKVGGYDAKPTASFTRPADTTQYAAGEVVGTSPATVMEFTGAALSPGQGGIVYGAMLIDEANQATKLSAPELWLFTMPPAAVADNAAFAPSDDALLYLVGVLPFSTSYVGNAGSGADGNVVFVSEKGFAYLCEPGRSSLYGVLVTRSAYTPVSGEQFNVRLDLALR